MGATVREHTRSVLHGACLLGGKHQDPAMAASCPVLRAQGVQGDREIAPAVDETAVRTVPVAETHADIASPVSNASESRQARHRSRRIEEAGGIEEYRRRERERVRASRARKLGQPSGRADTQEFLFPDLFPGLPSEEIR